MQKFSNIRTLIEQGRYKEAKKNLDQIESQENNRCLESDMELLFWNTVSYLYSGNYTRGKKSAYLYHQKSILIDNELFRLKALLLITWVKLSLGMLNEGLIGIEKANSLLNKLKNNKTENLGNLEAKILLLNGSLYNKKGDFEKALYFYSKSLELSDSIGYIENSTTAIKNIGIVYLKKGELDEALKYLEQSKEISKNNNLTLNEIKSKLNIGIVYLRKGELEKSFELFTVCLRFLQKIDHQPLIASILSYVGRIYSLQGKLNTALEYQRNCLTIREKIGNKLEIARSHADFGNIYIEKGEFNLAKKSFEKTLFITEYNGYYNLKVWTLFDLIYLLRMNLSKETISNYLKEIDSLNENQPNKLYNQINRLAKALVLRNSGGNRLVDMVESHQLLQNLVIENEKEILDQEINIASISALTDSLFYELRITKNIVIIDELENLSNKLLKIAEDQNSFILLAKNYLLKAKIELAKRDISQARRFMIKAQNIADEKSLKRLAQLISFEHDKLLEESDYMDESSNEIDSDPQISRKVSESIILFNGKANVKIPTKEEVPIFLSIIANNGICIFDCKFQAESTVHGQLIAGFLSAINNFGQEVLSSIGTFDRLKHGEHTIVMRPKNDIMFAYAFTGQSYTAIKKLDRFMNNLSCLDNIWTSLNDSRMEGSLIPQQERFVINTLVSDIFLKSNEFY